MVARSAVVLIALLAGLAPLSAGRQPAPTRDHLVLITLDGVRTSEIFTGLDVEILRSTLGQGCEAGGPGRLQALLRTPPRRRDAKS